MRIKPRRLIVAISLFAMPLMANATLIQINATANDPTNFSNWSLIFNDTGDGLVEAAEIVSFSGATYAPGGIYDSIVGTPTVAGISIASGITPGFWSFRGPALVSPPEDSWNGSRWTYTKTAVAVPVGSALPLLGLALLGLGIRRRK